MNKLLILLITAIALNAIEICDQKLGEPVNTTGFSKSGDIYKKETANKLCTVYTTDGNATKVEQINLQFFYIKPFPSMYKADFVKAISRMNNFNGSVKGGEEQVFTDVLDAIKFQKTGYLKSGTVYYENDEYRVIHEQQCKGSKSRCGNKFTFELVEKVEEVEKPCQNYECIKHLL